MLSLDHIIAAVGTRPKGVLRGVLWSRPDAFSRGPATDGPEAQLPEIRDQRHMPFRSSESYRRSMSLRSSVAGSSSASTDRLPRSGRRLGRTDAAMRASPSLWFISPAAWRYLAQTCYRTASANGSDSGAPGHRRGGGIAEEATRGTKPLEVEYPNLLRHRFPRCRPVERRRARRRRAPRKGLSGLCSAR